MPACAVIGCSLRYSKDECVRLFGLPTVILNQCPTTKELSTHRRTLWLSRINRKWGGNKVSNGTVKVCHRHFINGEPSKLFDFSHPDWAPTLDLGYDYRMKNNIETASVARYLRTMARRRKKSTTLPSVANQLPRMGATGTENGESTWNNTILHDEHRDLEFSIMEQTSAEPEQLDQEEVELPKVIDEKRISRPQPVEPSGRRRGRRILKGHQANHDPNQPFERGD